MMKIRDQVRNTQENAVKIKTNNYNPKVFKGKLK